MSNYITASVEFYFKGEKITSSIELDIDPHMHATGQLPDLYPLLARAINLSFYSYEYEMMQAESIQFSQAEGLVADFIVDGQLDIQAFEPAWREHTILSQLQDIAKGHMAIEDLQEHPELEKALREAFQLGQDKTTN